MIETIFVIIFSVLLIICIVFNIFSILKKSKMHYNISKKQIFNEEDYPSYIVKETNKTYEKVMSGKIRKHIIKNDLDYYDSTKTMKQYADFLVSEDMQKLVMEKQDTLYNG